MTDWARHLGPRASEGHEAAASRAVVVRPCVVVWAGSARAIGAACVMALCLPRFIIVSHELGVANADAHLRNGKEVSHSSTLPSLSQATPPRLAPSLCRRPPPMLLIAGAPSAAPPHLLYDADSCMQIFPPCHRPRCRSEVREEGGYERARGTRVRRGVRTRGGTASGSIRLHLHVHPGAQAPTERRLEAAREDHLGLGRGRACHA